MPILDLCDGKKISVQKGTSLQKAAAVMQDKHIGSVVVVDPKAHDKPIGILTDRDIVLKAAAKDASMSKTLVEEIMSTHLVKIAHDAGLNDAIKLMQDKAVRRILVVDREDRLCGVLSSDDLIQLVGQELNRIGDLYQRQARNEEKVRVAHS